MNNYFYSLLLALLLFSCDVSTPTSETIATTSDAQLFGRSVEPSAANVENPYDYAGFIYNELLDSYASEVGTQTALDSIIYQVNLLAASNVKYGVYFGGQTNAISPATLQNILLDPQTALTDYLAVSLLKAPAQTSLQDFSSDLQYFLNAQTDYAIIYDYIIAFETGILLDTSYTPDEQAVLLHISSIVRQAVYEKKKRPKPNRDPDWDWMLTCIVATSVESNRNFARGILNAVVLDLARPQVTH